MPENDLFPAHASSPATVRAEADRLLATRGDLQVLGDDVRGRARTASTSTTGDLVDPVALSADPTADASRRLADASMFAGGLLRVWATAVEGYNSGLTPLNDEWRSAQDDLPVPEGLRQRLERDEQRLSAALDDEARTIIGHLDQGPSGAGLALLLDEDAISSAEFLAAEPALLTDQASLVAALQQESAGLAAVRDMSDADLAAWLGEHPDVTDDVWQALERRVGGWDSGQAGADAATIIGAMDAETDGSGVREAMDGLALLGAVGVVGQKSGRTLPGTSADYLRTFYGDLDKTDGGLQRFTDWIAADEHSIRDVRTRNGTVSGYMGNPVPVSTTTTTSDVDGYDQATQDAMLGSLADGLVLLSDDKAGAGLGMAALPQSVRDQLDDTTSIRSFKTFPDRGQPSEPRIELEGGEGFGDLTDLLRHADPGVTAGNDLSRKLTDSSADVAADINTLHEGSNKNKAIMPSDALHGWQERLQGAVAIATRNEDANTLFLEDAAKDTSGRDGEDAKDGLAPEGAAADLRALYGMDWADQGAAVSDYTDWIPGAQDRGLADRASIALIDAVTSTEKDSSGNNTFQALMTGAPDSYLDGDKSPSLGENNPLISRSFAGVAASQLDAFSSTTSSSDTSIVDGDKSIATGDRSRFMTLVAGDDEGRRQLSITAGAYEQALVNQALGGEERWEGPEGTKPPSLEEAGRRSGYLDAVIGAGVVNDELIAKDTEYAETVKEYRRNLVDAGIGKTMGAGLFGSVPIVGGLLGAGFSAVGDEIIAQTLPYPELPDGVSTQQWGDGTAETNRLAHDFIEAKLTTYPDHVPPEVQSVLDRHDGKLPAYDAMSDRTAEDLLKWAEQDDRFKDYRSTAQGENVFEHLALEPRGAVEGSSSALKDYLTGVRLG